MDKMSNIFRTVNILTGKTGRRNKAFSAVSEWAATLHEFLTSFGLYGSAELGTLLDKPGNAKFELVSITYNGRPVVSQSKALKGTEIPDLVAVIVDEAESIRRYLLNPVLQEIHLKKAVLNLRVDYEKLQATLNQFDLED